MFLPVKSHCSRSRSGNGHESVSIVGWSPKVSPTVTKTALLRSQSRAGFVLMNLLLAALGPKPEPAHPEMLSTTLVGGAGMQHARRAVERPVNVKI